QDIIAYVDADLTTAIAPALEREEFFDDESGFSLYKPSAAGWQLGVLPTEGGGVVRGSSKTPFVLLSNQMDDNSGSCMIKLLKDRGIKTYVLPNGFCALRTAQGLRWVETPHIDTSINAVQGQWTTDGTFKIVIDPRYYQRVKNHPEFNRFINEQGITPEQMVIVPVQEAHLSPTNFSTLIDAQGQLRLLFNVAPLTREALKLKEEILLPLEEPIELGVLLGNLRCLTNMVPQEFIHKTSNTRMKVAPSFTSTEADVLEELCKEASIQEKINDLNDLFLGSLDFIKGRQWEVNVNRIPYGAVMTVPENISRENLQELATQVSILRQELINHWDGLISVPFRGEDSQAPMMSPDWRKRFDEAPRQQKEDIAVNQAPPDEEKSLTSIRAVIRFIRSHGKDWWYVARLRLIMWNLPENDRIILHQLNNYLWYHNVYLKHRRRLTFYDTSFLTKNPHLYFYMQQAFVGQVSMMVKLTNEREINVLLLESIFKTAAADVAREIRMPVEVEIVGGVRFFGSNQRDDLDIALISPGFPKLKRWVALRFVDRLNVALIPYGAIAKLTPRLEKIFMIGIDIQVDGRTIFIDVFDHNNRLLAVNEALGSTLLRLQDTDRPELQVKGIVAAQYLLGESPVLDQMRQDHALMPSAAFLAKWQIRREALLRQLMGYAMDPAKIPVEDIRTRFRAPVLKGSVSLWEKTLRDNNPTQQILGLIILKKSERDEFQADVQLARSTDNWTKVKATLLTRAKKEVVSMAGANGNYKNFSEYDAAHCTIYDADQGWRERGRKDQRLLAQIWARDVAYFEWKFKDSLKKLSVAKLGKIIENQRKAWEDAVEYTAEIHAELNLEALQTRKGILGMVLKDFDLPRQKGKGPTDAIDHDQTQRVSTFVGPLEHRLIVQKHEPGQKPRQELIHACEISDNPAML
ncbi:MAG: hypothetical protein WCH62_06225, partial [Candidatus Omnitrophota bacterium]